MMSKLLKDKKNSMLLKLIIILSVIFIYRPLYAVKANPPHVKEYQKCPVCGMRVLKLTNWHTQIVYSDGVSDAFCAVKCLMAFYLEHLKYCEKKKSDSIRELYARDYYSQSWHEMKSMFFVSGSDVLGPMGKDLIPFADIGKAKIFFEDHNGRRILKFDEITLVLIKELRNKKISD